MKPQMKSTTQRIILSVVFLALLGGAYELGKRQESKAQSSHEVESVSARKILYYRNPMGLPDTSPVPKKDEMGMDYIPVYAEDAAASGIVNINLQRRQLLGVRTVSVERQNLHSRLRAFGRLEVDESKVQRVAPRFSGWVDQLLVSRRGDQVERGQTLFTVYSPELETSLRDYQLNRAAAAALAENTDAAAIDARQGLERLTAASQARLRNFQIDPASLKNSPSANTASSTSVLRLRSPARGVVLEKQIEAGQRFEAGQTLYRLADLSRLWLIAEIPEQQLARLQNAKEAAAEVRFSAWPDRVFLAHIDKIYPSLNATTRSVSVRLLLDNPQGQLKPDMYAEVEFKSPAQSYLTVPNSALIRTGEREIVLVETAAGQFQPRVVESGLQTQETTAIIHGLQAGEKVVVAANFLIDAESNLRAALAALQDETTHSEHADHADHADHGDHGEHAHHGNGNNHGDHSNHGNHGAQASHDSHGLHDSAQAEHAHAAHSAHSSPAIQPATASKKPVAESGIQPASAAGEPEQNMQSEPPMNHSAQPAAHMDHSISMDHSSHMNHGPDMNHSPSMDHSRHGGH